VVLLSIAAIVAIYICLTIAVTVRVAVYSTQHPGEAISRSTVEQLTFNPYVLVSGQGLGYVALVAVMMWLVRGRYKSPFWPSLKWNWPGRQWFAYLVGGVGLAIVVQFALQFLPMPKSLPIQRYFETAEGAYLMAFFGILIAPPVEELFFRGFLYPVLARGIARAAWRIDPGSGRATAALVRPDPRCSTGALLGSAGGFVYRGVGDYRRAGLLEVAIGRLAHPHGLQRHAVRAAVPGDRWISPPGADALTAQDDTRPVSGGSGGNL
jgi:membrane protease YdiL (CAAX protease family)